MTDEPLLSPPRAFVVQFYPQASLPQGPFLGRVEHVVSRKSTHFDSLESLMGFMGQILAEVNMACRKEV